MAEQPIYCPLCGNLAGDIRLKCEPEEDKASLSKKSIMNQFGVHLNRGKITYELDGGWFLWAPYWAKTFIAHVWNRLACMALGHDKELIPLYKAGAIKEAPSCLACGTELKVDGRYLTASDLREHQPVVNAFDTWLEEAFKKKMDEHGRR